MCDTFVTHWKDYSLTYLLTDLLIIGYMPQFIFKLTKINENGFLQRCRVMCLFLENASLCELF